MRIRVLLSAFCAAFFVMAFGIISAEAQLLYEENFDAGAPGWAVVKDPNFDCGKWKAEAGGYVQSDLTPKFARAWHELKQDLKLGELTYEWEIEYNGGSACGGIVIFASENDQCAGGKAGLTPWHYTNNLYLYCTKNGDWLASEQLAPGPVAAANGKTIKYKATYDGEEVEIWAWEAGDKPPEKGVKFEPQVDVKEGNYIMLGTNTSNVRFDNVRVYGPKGPIPQAVTVQGKLPIIWGSIKSQD